MIKLTQPQIAVLASAATQPDGFVIRPANLKSAAAAKIAAKLIAHGLVRELHAKGDAPVWREDEHGKRFSLKILKAGRALVVALTSNGGAAASHGTPGCEPTSTEQIASSSGRDAANTSAVTSARPTKRSLILGLMSREGGASLDELIAGTGWLPHTTRAALTGLRKSGFAVERSRSESGSSIYRIASAPAAEAA